MQSKTTSSLTGARLEFIHELSRSALGGHHLALRTTPGAPPQILLSRTIPLHTGGSTGAELLRRAARMSLSFRHSHLLKVIGFEETSCDLLVLSEWVDGLTLATVRQLLLSSERPAPIGIVVRLALEMAEAAALVRATHPRARTLRLIWNDSAVVTTAGRLLISEPGILSSVSHTELALCSPAVLGELTPEERMGYLPSETSDVYAIGTLMWELLAHQRAILADPAKSDPHRRDSGLPSLAPLRRAGPLVPERLLQLVSKATRSDPERRLRSPALLAAELESLAPEIRAKPTDVRILLSRIAAEPLREQRLAKEWALAQDRSWLQQLLPLEASAPSAQGDVGPADVDDGQFLDREAPTRPEGAISCARLRVRRQRAAPHVSGTMLAKGSTEGIAEETLLDGTRRRS